MQSSFIAKHTNKRCKQCWRYK